MDMSDLAHGTEPAPGSPASSHNVDAERWQALVGTVGGEIAAPLTSALERINALTTTGKIDKAGLRALRDEVEAARRAGMIAQQITRYATARMRQSHERLALAETLRSVLAHRARETQARGICVKQSLKAADVIVDPSLLFSLLNTTLDWALACARSEIDFHIDMKAWPAHARLACRFAHRPPDELDDGASPPPGAALDSLTWHLVEQTAWTMGLPITRSVSGGEARLVIEFPRTAGEQMEGVSTVELDQGFGLSSSSRPLAGSQVLVIASRREMRVRIRDAIRHMGLTIDMVSSIDEANDFCHEGVPHAIIVEGILNGEKFRQLRAEITASYPEFPFIEIVEEGSAFSMSGFGGATMGRVGREAIDSALPSVLMFELSRTI